jgi:hypothetical protein
MMRKFPILAASLSLALAGSTAFADDIVQISQTAFNAGAGLITFSEFDQGTVNPVYAPATYGGGAGSPTVTFGGYFNGQTGGSTNPGACPAGAAVTGCVLGNPTGPLAINPNSPQTFIASDSAMPTSPVLSGSPLFNGSIAIKFSTPQAGVGLDGGYFDAIGSTAITAYGVDGTILGSVKNSQIGDDFLGLVTADGQADIAGLLFSLVGDEPAGFDIDNVEFGTGAEVTVPGGGGGTPPAVTPEPSTLLLLGTGIVGLASSVRRRFVGAGR